MDPFNPSNYGRLSSHSHESYSSSFSENSGPTFYKFLDDVSSSRHAPSSSNAVPAADTEYADPSHFSESWIEPNFARELNAMHTQRQAAQGTAPVNVQAAENINMCSVGVQNMLKEVRRKLSAQGMPDGGARKIKSDLKKLENILQKNNMQLSLYSDLHDPRIDEAAKHFATTAREKNDIIRALRQLRKL